MVALLLGSLAGCGQKEAVDFNNTLANSNVRLRGAGEQFGQAVRPALEGAPGSMEQLRARFKTVEDTLKTIKTESKSWKVPDNAKAKNLYETHQRFLKVQEEAVQLFADLVKVVENPQLTIQMKAEQIDALAKGADGKEKVALVELQAAQQAFAKEYNIKLNPAK